MWKKTLLFKDICIKKNNSHYFGSFLLELFTFSSLLYLNLFIISYNVLLNDSCIRNYENLQGEALFDTIQLVIYC